MAQTTSNNSNAASDAWSPESWRQRPVAHDVAYPDSDAVQRALDKLRSFPPLVTSWEIEKLKAQLAEAERGERILLQGGDCAETLADCRPEPIASKLKILLQMSLVLVHGSHTPVIRVGRFAGQYAKPRSQAEEEGQQGDEGATLRLPSYFGDLINAAEFDAHARQPNPDRMIDGYQHASLTLNFIRSLLDGGFADLHHPEVWNLSFMGNADLPPERKAAYEKFSHELASALKFMEALGERTVDELSRVEFFTSHEGLNLLYESAQTRTVPHRPGWWDLTTHLPWIGERTRQIDGAHVEFFRGIENPVGVKLGPKSTGADALALSVTLNPKNEPGKLVFITRFGAGKASGRLPELVGTMERAGRRCLWVSDPMHGNTVSMDTPSGPVKTRRFDDIHQELGETIETHQRLGSVLGGLHFELTGEDVTECVGGAAGVTAEGLAANYVSPCDPRLNYQQSLELAFLLAGRLGSSRNNTRNGD
ncbi:MAG: 3-deoxy-7-phosphoheptulonate synthase class II [Planctomycetota bacterium]